MIDSAGFQTSGVDGLRTRGFAFGGLRLSSAMELPFLSALPQSSGDADVHISVSSNPLPDGELLHRSIGRYGLELHKAGADWLFRHGMAGVVVAETGRRLVCHCPDPADLPLLAEILVRRVLPRICYLHGRLPIHAATLSGPAGAVMLLGTSGAGKSTMTAALARYLDWGIFSDDMSVLDDTGPVTALSGTEGVSLWEESVAGLDIPADRVVPMTGYDGKFSYRPHATPPAPMPLNAVLLLTVPAEDSAVGFERLTGPEVLVTLCSQIVRFNRRDVAENGDLMRRLGRVASDVPVFALSYPRAFAKLPAVAEAVAAHLDCLPA